MKHFFTLALVLTTLCSHAQDLFTKTFGNPKNQAVIFIHGGPGSSSAAFGATTANRLADQGFYVVLYDRRGEGLSKDENAKYTFYQTFDDLNKIYKKFNLKKATLIGFSFGGIVATLYAEKYPEKINNLALISALLSQPETYKNILNRSKIIYQLQKDTINYNEVLNIERMDKNSFEYRSACFKHSSRNGFFSTQHQSELAKKLYRQMESDPIYIRFSIQKNNDAVNGFWKNEHYSNLNIMPILKRLTVAKMKIYAMYGKDDGLFSTRQVMNLHKLIGKHQLKYLDNCAHYLYTDQQDLFINALKTWIAN